MNKKVVDKVHVSNSSVLKYKILKDKYNILKNKFNLVKAKDKEKADKINALLSKKIAKAEALQIRCGSLVRNLTDHRREIENLRKKQTLKIDRLNASISRIRSDLVNSLLGDTFLIVAESFSANSLPSLPEGAAIKRVGGFRIAYPANSLGSDFVVDRLLASDPFLIKVPQLFLNLLLNRRGGVMIDVGANIGTTAIPPLLLGLVDRVIAIEPSGTNFDCLRWTIEANELSDSIDARRIALGDSVGVAELTITNASGLHHLKSLTETDALHHEKLSMHTLDALAEEITVSGERLSFVKIDCQGAELSILRGARQLLQRPDVTWEVEFWPNGILMQGSDPQELLDIVTEHFDYFVDEKSERKHLRPITELRACAASITGNHHTDFFLVPRITGLINSRTNS